MSKQKQTPLTVEVFFEAIMPRIEEIIGEKIDSKFDEKFDEKVLTIKKDVLSYKVETVGEIKALREEVVVINHQYRRSDKRLDRLEKKLKLAPVNF